MKGILPGISQESAEAPCPRMKPHRAVWRQDCGIKWQQQATNMEQVEMNGTDSRIGFGLMLFLGGLGAGVALTVLLAPRSGAVTRRLIGRSVNEGTDWVKEKAAMAQACAKDYSAELRGRAAGVAEEIGRTLRCDAQRP